MSVNRYEHDDEQTISAFEPRLDYSSVSHALDGMRDVVAAFANVIRPRRYLEIGLGKGDNFTSVPAVEIVGITPNTSMLLCHITSDANRSNRIYEGCSDDVFASSEFKKEDVFDLIFIDGLHLYEQAMRDIVNSLRCVSDRGVILVHDINPLDKPDQVSSREHPRSATAWCGDVWKCVPHVKRFFSGVKTCAIERFPGWFVIWRDTGHRLRTPLMDYPLLDMSIVEARNNRHEFEFTTLDKALAQYTGVQASTR